ncbi:homoserine O-acetyltransferase [Gordonia hirsuta DSM 44140 = NBRC 16056]|uniref:Homoserine O-acetyltransferase n=1 Tax=Gordonia hirsuta DSM 44140 = NBRC 16056 TaxID=1121927 RepID=L7L8W3_9ACTN|nr:alpha/beta fold hydrolase [Gordonia hirsuta]GAC57201.1 homoserine O-acetyltransferase [Gordonia hirsuta DSM 44140 = NBRC 16056]
MPIENAFYTPEAQGPYQLHSLGRFELEDGGVIDELQLAVATRGTLNDDKSNAILIPTWFSGTHQTWDQVYIGPGRALDPEKYFLVIVNQIGNGLSTSPHNTDDSSIAMSKFPTVRIGDDVRAQEQLLREVFGIERLALVVGGSMGAQQTWEWAVRFPEKVLRAAPIAGTAQNTPHDFLFTQTLLEAITSDPGWNDGEYTSHLQVQDGLGRHADIWATMGLSTDFWKSGFWQAIPMLDGTTTDDFRQFQAGFLRALFQLMDPNALLTMGWKWQHGDVARHTDGDLAAALGRITATTFVMPIDRDMFFPVSDCAAEAELTPGAQLRVLPSIAGHFGLFGFNPEYIDEVDRNLSELLATRV